MKGDVDVLVVGSGPAGIFAALEVTRLGPARVLILEKGTDLPQRIQAGGSRISGWGGAGAFSDGKLNLSPGVGGRLAFHLNEPELRELIHYVDKVYLSCGAPQAEYAPEGEAFTRLAQEAVRRGLRLVPSRIRHLGTDRCPQILLRLRESLGPSVEVVFGAEVAGVEVEEGRVIGVVDARGHRYRAPYVILAVGREGSDWLGQEARRLGLTTFLNPVDIGVRVEVPAAVMAPLTEVIYEAKFHYRSRAFDDPVRTFCMCPNGEVIREEYGELQTVNGHSYADHRTENTNFAILVSTAFTEPFREPIAYGQSVARLANLLGGHVLVQRLGDLRAGRRSTHDRIARGHVTPTLAEATPGDLSFVLPHRHMVDILEMLEAMDWVVPGVNASHTLLYGVEVKFYSLRLEVSRDMETGVQNLFAVGDGSGVSRGLVQASASGVLAAREVARHLGFGAS